MIKNEGGQSISASLIKWDSGQNKFVPVTSGTVTVYVTLAGGTQTAGEGSVEHEGNGQWTYFPTQAETNADEVAFLFTHADAPSVNLQVYTTPYRVSAETPTQPVAPGITGLNRFAIREEVRRIIRDRDYPKRDIDRAINSVIASLNQMGRFKFHQTFLDISLEANKKDYNLTGIIGEELVVYKPDTEDEAIIFKAPDLITPYSEGWFVDTDDEPEYYVVWGNKIYLEPIPDSVAAGETLRVYGFFRLPLFTDDLTAISLHEHYCISILAWGAAAELNPTMVVESSGKQGSIAEVYRSNLATMRMMEVWEPAVSHNLIRDYKRWSGLSGIGFVSRVR